MNLGIFLKAHREIAHSAAWIRLDVNVTERSVRSWSRCTGSHPQVTISHRSGGRLPLLSARPAVAFPAAEHHYPLAAVPSYTVLWQRHIGVNNLPKVVTQLLPRVWFEPTTCWSQVQRHRAMLTMSVMWTIVISLCDYHLCPTLMQCSQRVAVFIVTQVRILVNITSIVTFNLQCVADFEARA